MANAVVYIIANENYNILAYLDDFGGFHPTFYLANKAYTRFLSLAEELGIELSTHKCTPPTTCIDWLGYKVDSIEMSVTIPPEKMKEIVDECEQWLNRDKASKKMIQAIVGKLIFVSNCIATGRRCLTRILRTLSYMGENAWTTLSTEFKADIRWFSLYAKTANGIFLCPTQQPTIDIECDSSLTAGGGNSDGYYYAWKYTKAHIEKHPHIHQLEAINILISYITLAKVGNISPANVTIWTDNMASSYALSTGRTKDPILAACARELWLQAAKFNHQVEIRHKSGALIPLADTLSRMFHDKGKAALARRIISEQSLISVTPVIKNYNFFNEFL